MLSKPKSAVKASTAASSAGVQITRFSGLLSVSDARLRAIAAATLKPGYALSLVICGDARMRSLNVRYRNKNTPANVLSFPLSATEGEIFLNTARILREAKDFDLSPNGHMEYLLIHGCLHLNGYTHGSTMEKAEKALRTRFGVR